jgi:PTS system fructose-specific IIA component
VQLSELLAPERVRVPLESKDKAGLLRELATLMAGSVGGDAGDILKAVEEREEVLSTGIGFGVAIPHGRTPSVPNLAMVAGVTAAPVAFDALDGEPVRVLFLLVGPERSAGEHCKALSRIARLARSDTLRTQLLQSRSGDEFMRALVQAEAS